MRYCKRIPLGANESGALELARQRLAAWGFRVGEDGDYGLVATFSGWKTKNRPVVVGASEVRVQAREQTLEIRASYGNLRRSLWLFFLIFPVGFTLLFSTLSTVIPGMPGPIIGLATGPPALLVIVLAWAAGIQGIGAALDTLLVDAATAAGQQDAYVAPTRPPLSTALWVLFGLGCLAGLAATVCLMILAIYEAGQAVARVVVPGSGAFALDAAGTYTIFHEYRGIIKGNAYQRAPDWSDIQLNLQNRDTAEHVTLTPSGARTRYSYGSHAGFSILTFDIEGPGHFVLTGEAVNDEVTRTVLAVTPWDTHALEGPFALALALLVALPLAAVICFTMAWYAWRADRKSRA